MAKQNIFDAIVVGSGISGGWAAKELTEKGLKSSCFRAWSRDQAHRRLRNSDEKPMGIQSPWSSYEYGG